MKNNISFYFYLREIKINFFIKFFKKILILKKNISNNLISYNNIIIFILFF